MPTFVVRAALLLLGSGFCALVYQSAWLRMLRVVFGATTSANAAVLAIFMGGLGLGAWWIGRRVEARSDPLRLYAVLEVGVALSAAATPLLVPAVREVYVAAGGSAALGGAGGAALRLVLSAIVLGVPAFLMGGTLPALARAVEHGADVGRRSASLLYGLNTLGAVLGVLVTTFWATEALGVRATVWSACALNLAVAGAAAWLARGRAPVPVRERAVAPSAGGVAPRPLVLAAAALTGGSFLLMELVWYRMLAPLLGGSAYTFGLVLATALAGIGVGGVLYAMGDAGRRPTLVTFATSCALEALLLGVPYALGDRLAVLAALLGPVGTYSFPGLAAGWAAVCAIVVLPAAIVSGWQFPALLGLLGAGDEDVGADVGRLYAWNTAGAIAGSLAGGFGLLPLLGAPLLWRTTVGALALLAVLFLMRAALDGARAGSLVAPLALAGLAVGTRLAEGPTAVWRHSGVGAGIVDARWSDANASREFVHQSRRSVLWETDGVEASLAMNRTSGVSFFVNGKSDGHVRGDAATQVMAGVLAALRHPGPKRVLVVGLGTGETAGWLAALPEVERVDVVELEPAMRVVAEACRAANNDVLTHPKVRLHIGDAREVIATSRETWDLIVSEPSNPYRHGVSALFSRDFYEIVDAKLAPGGLFAQWLQAYQVHADTVRTAYATLGAVFPAVETWEVMADADLLFLATRAPNPHDLAALRSRVEGDTARAAMVRAWGVDGVDGLYTGFVAGPTFARAVADAHTGPLHTDDQPVFEFAMARALSQTTRFSVADLRALAEARGEGPPPALDAERLLELRTARALGQGRPFEVSASLTGAARARAEARAAWRAGDPAAAMARWTEQASGPVAPVDATMLAEALAALGDPQAPAFADALDAQSPVEARLAYARWFASQQRWEEAARALAAGLRGFREDPWASPPVVERALRSAPAVAAKAGPSAPELLEALSRPFAARALDDLRMQVRASAAVAARDDHACVAAFAEMEPWVPWRADYLETRAGCYRRTGHPLAAAAEGDLAAFRSVLGLHFSDGIPTDQDRP